MIGTFLFGAAKVLWGGTKLTFKLGKIAYKAGKRIVRLMKKTKRTGKKLRQGVLKSIAATRRHTSYVLNSVNVVSDSNPGIKESTIFTKPENNK